MAQRVIEVGRHRVRVHDRELYLRAMKLLAEDIADGNISVPGEQDAEGSGACEDACQGHGGVDICGSSVVVCNDGEVFIIDP